MPKNKLAGNKPTESTQKYLDIAEIRDDAVVLKDGGLRAVLLVSSINFALKGEDEQNAIIQSYVSFLNSLDFPIQIVVQSRNLNIDGYMEKLKNLEKEQTNELLRMQIADYRSFLSELLDMGQIMTKRFYVVVPYSGGVKSKKKFFDRVATILSPAHTIHLSKKTYTQYHEELMKRVGQVEGGLTSVGLQVALLDTQSLIELYYNSYNPEMINSEKLTDVNNLRVED